MRDPHDPHSEAGPQGEADLDTTIEEATEFDSNATVQETRPRVPEEPVQGIGEFDLDATIEESGLPDPNATIVEDNRDTLIPEEDPDKTVVDDDLDQTVEELDPAATVLDQTVDFKTVSESKLDETVETLADASDHNPLPGDSKANQSGDESIEHDESVSVMDSTNLTRTINPDTLSPAESEYWNSISAEFVSPREPTVSTPAIDRTVVETRLQIRDQIVATNLQGENEAADYRLIRLLGRGGMGNVFVARQGSLDRLIAVKVIRPLDAKKKEKLAAEGKLEKVEQGRRQQFLTEAVVTGDLDHPNIVPIHDVAITGDSTLFYSMKRVVGTPWSDVINQQTRDENLEVLLKVADAVGFAHTRGVIHRDIKPDNVMLGDFGVVMVMDWGIALAKPEFEKLDSITPATGLGGTPSMMAPEMAIGPLERIGPPADIYLLGATLFMIMTGKPPHHAGNVSQCLKAVANNKIRDFDPKHQGELMNIALKAMADREENRYANVKAFQDAIRDYRSHSESIALAVRAEEDRKAAKDENSYTKFARAQFGFEEAIKLWPGNDAAKTGLHQTRIDHAEAAYQNADYEIGLSLLSDDEPDHADLLDRIREALKLRRQREAGFGLLKKIALALLAFILIAGSAATYWINEFRDLAVTNAAMATEQTRIANENSDLAKAKEKEASENAEEASRNADEARKNERLAQKREAEAEESRRQAKASESFAKQKSKQAEASAEEARVAQSEAEYESYVSKIGLAKARIDRNEFSEARRLLTELSQTALAENPDASLPWEIRYLKSLANQAAASVQTPASIVEVAVVKLKRTGSAGQQEGLVRFNDGRVGRLEINTDTLEMKASEPSRIVGGSASAISISDDGSLAAIGTSDGRIEIFPMETFSQWRPTIRSNRTLTGHRDQVTGLQFTEDGFLVSSSVDRTVRIWDPQSQTPLATCWHIAPVVDVSAVLANPNESSSPMLIAAAVGQKSTGQVVVWKANHGKEMFTERQGVFNGHQTALTCIALSPDGQTVASGDLSGEVLAWPISQVKRRDTEGLIQSAVKSLGKGSARELSFPKTRSKFALNCTSENENQDGETSPAHQSTVRSVRFSADGRSIVSSGDDYLISVWQPPASTSEGWRQTNRLRGHGGPVHDAIFVGDEDEKVLSAGIDQSVRLWTTSPQPRTDRELNQQLDFQPESSDSRYRQVHQDQIWSASLSADGNKLITASRDRTAKISAIDPDRSTLRTTASLDLDPEGKMDLSEGSLFRAMTMRTNESGKFLFVGGADSVVRIWNVERGTEVGQLEGTGLNRVLAVSHDGRTIVTGSSEPKVRAIVWKWDRDSSQVSRVHQLAVHEETVAALAIDHDSKRAVTGDRAGRIVLWDLSSGEPIGPPVDLLLGIRINDLAFDATGNQIWVAADDERLSRIDLQSRTIGQRLDHQGFVTKVRLSDDGRLAFTTSELQKTDRIIHRATLWQLTADAGDLSLRDEPLSQNLITMSVPLDAQTFDGGRPGIGSIDFGAMSSQALLSLSPAGEPDSRVEIWNIDGKVGNAKKKLAFGLPSRLGEVSEIATLPSGDLISLHGSSAYRWNLKTGKLDRSYRAHGAITTSAFSNDGKLVATGSRSIKIWDADNGKAIGKLESPHEGIIRSIAFLPDSSKTIGSENVLLTGGDDGLIHAYKFDTETSKFDQIEFVSARPDAGASLSLSFSLDGGSLLSTTDLGEVILYDVRVNTSRVLWKDAKQGRMTSGCLSADGLLVAAGGDDRLVRVWNLADDQMVVCQGHAEAIQSVAFQGSETAGNLRLFSASQDRSIRVWDPHAATNPEEGRELLELVGHEDGVTAIDLNPTGSLLMSAGRDGRVVLWPASP